jgi:integrase
VVQQVPKHDPAPFFWEPGRSQRESSGTRSAPAVCATPNQQDGRRRGDQIPEDSFNLRLFPPGKYHVDDSVAGRISAVYRAVINFLAYTGVRHGEMAGLRVRRLDLLCRRAHIVEAVADVNGHAVSDTPKTHSQRACPFLDQSSAS